MVAFNRLKQCFEVTFAEAIILLTLNKFKENRNMDNVKQSLSILRETASREDNLLPHIIDAVKAHATLGEISDVFREIFGQY